jgi:hypothetical protein
MKALILAVLKGVLILIFFSIGFITKSQGQEKNKIFFINTFMDTLSQKLPAEKLFLQLDKAFYTPLDTLWFKGYLFDAQYFNASSKSGIVYVELLDQDNKIARRLVVETSNGLFSGSIPLSAEWLKTGHFTLRSYTNWMRNWGPSVFFTKKLFFNPLTEIPVAEASQTLSINRTNTSPRSYGIKIQSDIDIDLQFMPEGGHLVNGMQSTVGFKAIASNGRGLALSGIVYNNRNQAVANFKSIHKGMGIFNLTPKVGETYYAVLTSDSKKYDLPNAVSSGVTMHVVNDTGSDKIQVHLASSPDLSDKSRYYLIAQSRGVICYGAIANFNNREITCVLLKNKFPSGIVRITLFDENLNPVNERITFIDHHDELKIDMNIANRYIDTRDSVTLRLKVTDKKGDPVEGSFSVAITDNGLAPADTSNNIVSFMLLSGDLQGEIEDPVYYLVARLENQAALECLLLTQGWVDYLKNKFKIPSIKYLSQSEYTVGGKITNLFNKGIPATRIKLLSKHPFFVLDTLTDQQGNFVFGNLPALDTADFLLQAINKKGDSKNVTFIMTEDQPAPLLPTKALILRTKTEIADSTLFRIQKNNTEIQNANAQLLHGQNTLKEVIIKGKKIVRGSKNLNGPGNADEIIDEKELLKAAKIPLIDLLNQNITGFHQGLFPARGISLSGSQSGTNNGAAPTFTDKNLHIRKSSYMIKSHRVKLVFDGIDAENYFQPADIVEGPAERLLFLKGIIEQFTAEDIKGLEVMYSGKYNNIYNANISSAYEQASFISPVNDLDYAYIEITTRSGKGPFINMKDGFYAYRPTTPSRSKAFYQPKYSSGSTSTKTDLRSTLHWEPYVVTDAHGEAIIKFYTSDRQGAFTIIAQGSNMNGLIGAGIGSFYTR